MATITQDKRQKKLIICLKRAEELWQCYSMVHSITKPHQQGGLSHVKIPKANAAPGKPPQWDTIYDQLELEQHILQQHQIHFSQANG